MIKCQNITKIYKRGDIETMVLVDICFEIKEGEFVAIIGPSGSGKSTLMNILGTLDKPIKGKYFLNNEDMLNFPDDKLAKIRSKKIGFVFQSFNLLPRANVIRNVMLPLIYDNDIKKEERLSRVEKASTSAGLEKERWYNLSSQLSGGQMQRVAIARALVNKPDLILADEPTGNLDSKTGDIVLDTFKMLNKKHKHTIVLITHERYVAEHADRIIELRDGKIISDNVSKIILKNK
jgi:putative ABC transport system ATP-binding protein